MRKTMGWALVVVLALVAGPPGARAGKADDLRALFQQMLALVQAGNVQAVVAAQREMVLPDPLGWFSLAFNERASHLHYEYSEYSSVFGSEEAAREFAGPLLDGRTQVQVVTLSRTGDPTHPWDRILRSRSSGATIYHVRFVRPGQPDDAFDCGYFAHVKGRFRTLGALRALTAD